MRKFLLSVGLMLAAVQAQAYSLCMIHYGGLWHSFANVPNAQVCSEVQGTYGGDGYFWGPSFAILDDVDVSATSGRTCYYPGGAGPVPIGSVTTWADCRALEASLDGGSMAAEELDLVVVGPGGDRSSLDVPEPPVEPPPATGGRFLARPDALISQLAPVGTLMAGVFVFMLGFKKVEKMLGMDKQTMAVDKAHGQALKMNARRR